jgi:hypothetical protein
MYIFRKDRAKFVTGLRHQTERDRRYHAREHILVVLVSWPFINVILDKLRRARYISTIDVKSRYWQVPLTPASKPTTAFMVPSRGLYQLRVMPFGLHSAPATFQRLMDRVMGPELDPYCFAYLDDIVVLGETFEQHLEVLQEVFRRLRAANLRLNPDK